MTANAILFTILGSGTAVIVAACAHVVIGGMLADLRIKKLESRWTK